MIEGTNFEVPKGVKDPMFEKEKVGKFTRAFLDASQGIHDGLLNALLEEANKWQLRKKKTWEGGQEKLPRKVGNNFDETFAGSEIDGIDGRIETIKLGESEKAFVITDIHGDEKTFEESLQLSLQSAIDGNSRVHLISLGDWAVIEMEGKAQSIEPLKAFLSIAALKKIKTDQIQELLKIDDDKEETLSSYFVKKLIASGLSEADLSLIVDNIKRKLETHTISGNGEYILTPTKQFSDQLSRKDKVMGLQRTEKFLKSLPQAIMMRTGGKDIFMSHFLPPLTREKDWEREGLASINGQNISDLRIRAGISGGFDEGISIAGQQESNKETWATGKLNIAKEHGVFNLAGTKYKPTMHGLGTFERILEKKGMGKKGAYLFGHESQLVPLGAKQLKGKDGKEDEVICFHTGGGKKVESKIMLTISDNGEIVQTKVG